jgi:hypothetical protein
MSDSEERSLDRWNWGAVLLPGIWQVGHGIRPSIVGTLTLGLPLVGAVITLLINLAQWRGLRSETTGPAAQALETSAISAGWMLGIYVLACLCSMRGARRANSLAYEQVRGDPQTLMARERLWSAAGVVVAVVLVTLVVWLISTSQAEHEKLNRIPTAISIPHFSKSV